MFPNVQSWLSFLNQFKLGLWNCSNCSFFSTFPCSFFSPFQRFVSLIIAQKTKNFILFSIQSESMKSVRFYFSNKSLVILSSFFPLLTSVETVAPIWSNRDRVMRESVIRCNSIQCPAAETLKKLQRERERDTDKYKEIKFSSFSSYFQLKREGKKRMHLQFVTARSNHYWATVKYNCSRTVVSFFWRIR